jgi:hypothetical protein
VPTYYVATTGTDGGGHTGAIGDPWATLAYALRTAIHGDLILMRGGTFAQGVVTNPASPFNSGMAWADPLRVANYPGEVVWLKPTSGAFVVEFEGTEQYIEFDGIGLDGTGGVTKGPAQVTGWTGGNAHHIRFKNLSIILGAASPFPDYAAACNLGQLIANTIGSNELINVELYQGQTLTVPGVGVVVQSSDNLIQDCRFHEFAGAAFQIANPWGFIPARNRIINPRCWNISGAP